MYPNDEAMSCFQTHSKSVQSTPRMLESFWKQSSHWPPYCVHIQQLFCRFTPYLCRQLCSSGLGLCADEVELLGFEVPENISICLKTDTPKTHGFYLFSAQMYFRGVYTISTILHVYIYIHTILRRCFFNLFPDECTR